MAQFARPASDVATGSWTTTPLWSKVDEGATGDGTTITSADNTSPDDADFSTNSVGDPGVSTGHILRAKWQKSATGGHSINAVLELWQGVPGTGTLIATLSVTGIDAVVTSTYTLSAGEANSITNYGTLHLRLSRQGDTGGSPSGRRSLVADFIELEVPDAAKILAADAGSFTATGQTANLEQGYEVVAAAGSFAFTGTDATLTHEAASTADSIAIGPIVYVQETFPPFPYESIFQPIEEPAAGAFTIVAESGSFSVTGQTANLEQGYELLAESNSFSVSGQIAALEQGYELTADSGSFAVSGTDANLEQGYEIAANVGSYAFTGTDATLTYTPLEVDVPLSWYEFEFDSLRETYHDALFQPVEADFSAFILIAGSGSFTISGSEATLLTDTGPGSAPNSSGEINYVLEGFGAGTYQALFQPLDEEAAALILTAESGSFAVSGQIAGLEQGYELVADAGSFAVSGQDASLNKGQTIVAEGGIYLFTGTDAGLGYNQRLNAESASFTVTGQSANLFTSSDKVLAADSGAFTVSGQDASFLYTRQLTANSGSFAIIGTDATLVYQKGIDAGPGSFDFNGSSVSLEYNQILVAGAGGFTMAGFDATLTKTFILSPTVQFEVKPDRLDFEVPAEDLEFEVKPERGDFTI